MESFENLLYRIASGKRRGGEEEEKRGGGEEREGEGKGREMEVREREGEGKRGRGKVSSRIPVTTSGANLMTSLDGHCYRGDVTHVLIIVSVFDYPCVGMNLNWCD